MTIENALMLILSRFSLTLILQITSRSETKDMTINRNCFDLMDLEIWSIMDLYQNLEILAKVTGRILIL